MDYDFKIQQMKTQAPGVIGVHGIVTTTTSGTIGSAQIWGGGASIAKTGGQTGRYTITIAPPVTGPAPTPLRNLTFMGGWATLLGPDSAAIANSKGSIAFFRDDDISEAGAHDGTVELQWVISTATAQADTEVADGASFFFAIYVGTPDKT